MVRFLIHRKKRGEVKDILLAKIIKSFDHAVSIGTKNEGHSCSTLFKENRKMALYFFVILSRRRENNSAFQWKAYLRKNIVVPQKVFLFSNNVQTLFH